jgi:hypothetical protein
MGEASLTQTQSGQGHPRGLIAASAARVAEMYTCRVPRPRPTLTFFLTVTVHGDAGGLVPRSEAIITQTADSQYFAGIGGKPCGKGRNRSADSPAR